MDKPELACIEKVREHVLKKFYEIFDGEFELPKYQSMDDIETEYISKDVDARDFIDQGIFGFIDIGGDDFLGLLDKIKLFNDKLQNAKNRFEESAEIKELKKIINLVEEKIKKLK